MHVALPPPPPPLSRYSLLLCPSILVLARIPTANHTRQQARGSLAAGAVSILAGFAIVGAVVSTVIAPTAAVASTAAAAAAAGAAGAAGAGAGTGAAAAPSVGAVGGGAVSTGPAGAGGAGALVTILSVSWDFSVAPALWVVGCWVLADVVVCFFSTSALKTVPGSYVGRYAPWSLHTFSNQPLIAPSGDPSRVAGRKRSRVGVGTLI